MSVVNNLRKIREDRGILQDDLTAGTGFCCRTISQVERGECTPSAEFMLRVSAYLNMMVEEIFQYSEYTFLPGPYILSHILCHTLPVDQISYSYGQS